MIDIDSDDIVSITKAAPNVGSIILRYVATIKRPAPIKTSTYYCSCGNVSKLSRITNLVDNSSFAIFAGFIDFLLPSVLVRSAGAISPLPNIALVSMLD